ncbi:MAG: hypothetical protein LBQ88_12435 [Treponema sp.]|jgi:hypothetical protein|nr:hypothetical protein [Treponema sp.]
MPIESAGALVAWETVQSILGLDDDQEEFTTFLINAASAQAEQYAGRILAARDVVLILDTTGGRSVMLKSYPIISITRICIDTGHVFPNDFDLSESEYGVLWDAGIIRLYNRRFPGAIDSFLFEGRIGYDPVPDDLQQAVIECVSANLRRIGPNGGTIGIKSMTAQGAITTNYEIDVPVSIRNVFLSYRSTRL